MDSFFHLFVLLMTSVVDVFCGVVKPGYGIGVASYSKHFSTYGESYTTTNTPYQVRHCRCEVLKRAIFIPRFFFVIYRNTKRLLSSRIRTTPRRLLRTTRQRLVVILRRLIPLLATKLRFQLITRRQLLTSLLHLTPLLATKLKPNPITQQRLLNILQQLTPLLATIPQLVITTRVLPISLTQQLLLTTMLHQLMELNPTITSTSPSQRVLLILRQLIPLMATGTKSMVTIPLLLATHMNLLPSPQGLLTKLQRATISPAITIAHTTWNLLPVPMKNPAGLF